MPQDADADGPVGELELEVRLRGLEAGYKALSAAVDRLERERWPNPEACGAAIEIDGETIRCDEPPHPPDRMHRGYGTAGMICWRVPDQVPTREM